MIEERRFARSSAMRLLYSWSMGDEEQLTTLKMLYEDGNMTKVDLAILRLGIYELGWCDESPAGATINECVELAKEYSVPQSGAYINGILSSYERDRQAEADESKQTER